MIIFFAARSLYTCLTCIFKYYSANNNTLIVINKFTQVFMSSDIEIPQSLEESALKIDKSFSTAEASLSPKKTTVGQMTGIVTHVSLFVSF